MALLRVLVNNSSITFIEWMEVESRGFILSFYSILLNLVIWGKNSILWTSVVKLEPFNVLTVLKISDILCTVWKNVYSLGWERIHKIT